MDPRSSVTVRLDQLEELFSPPSFGEFGASGDLQSGIERLVAELKATPGADLHVTVVVPDDARDPDVQDRLPLAIHRYAALRIRELQHQRDALRRDGMRSLLLCVPVVAALSVLSVLVQASGID